VKKGGKLSGVKKGGKNRGNLDEKDIKKKFILSSYY